MRKKIGEGLVQAGVITEDDLRRALAERTRTGDRLGVVLVRMNLATEEEIAKALAFQLGFPYISLADSPVDPSAVVLIPEQVALKHVCIAVRLQKNLLTVAMSDPLLFGLVHDLELQSGHRINQVVATRGDIIEAINTAYPDKAAAINAGPAASGPGMAASAPEDEASGPSGAGALAGSEDAPIVALADLIVKSGIKNEASDIHIEPRQKRLLIRHRLDGRLKEVMDVPRRVHEGLIARLKTIAGMDVAEKRLPQEGRLRVAAEDGSEIDFRVSTLRTVWGEKIVMRVRERHKDVPALDELGLSPIALEQLRHFVRHQHGMILVVGPTGSGKSTTLAAALRSMQCDETNIITIEDPVEYEIPGVNQTQINDPIELTFASALRSILRRDPDAVLVGGIRDSETAKIAMQAAVTGPLVLSTLHADDAPSVVTLLSDMGIEPHVIAGALVGVVAQRLVRRLCTHCRRQVPSAPETVRALNISEADGASLVCYEAVGCDQCNHTGYRGRIGLYEVMRVTDTMKRLIAGRATEDQIRGAAIASGMVSLEEDGLAKVKSGITTPEELLRVVADPRDVRTLCPGCGTAVAVDFHACPNCGRRTGGGCPHCGRALRPGWNFCPHCARSTELRRVPKRLRPAPNVAEFKK